MSHQARHARISVISRTYQLVMAQNPRAGVSYPYPYFVFRMSVRGGGDDDDNSNDNDDNDDNNFGFGRSCVRATDGRRTRATRTKTRLGFGRRVVRFGDPRGSSVGRPQASIPPAGSGLESRDPCASFVRAAALCPSGQCGDQT